MKLTVVGYWGGFPGKSEATSGYLLEKNGFNLLIDCGSAVVSQLQQYIQLEQLNAVILSHYHHDHVADIGSLQYGRFIRGMLNKTNQILPIYAHVNDPKFQTLTYKNVSVGHAYNSNQTLMIGPFTISFLRTNHPVECYAMRITDGKHVIVYTADSSFKEEFIPFSQNANLLLCECNLYANQDGKSVGHMNSLDAGTIAKEAEVQELCLTHLPHFGNHQQLIEEAKTIYNRNISLAHAGRVWKF